MISLPTVTTLCWWCLAGYSTGVVDPTSSGIAPRPAPAEVGNVVQPAQGGTDPRSLVDLMLTAVPNDTHLIGRLSDVKRTMGKFFDMLKAMSPALGQELGPVEKSIVAQFDALTGPGASADNPVLVVVRFDPAAKASDGLKLAVLVPTTRPRDFFKAMGGEAVTVPTRRGEAVRVFIEEAETHAYAAVGSGYGVVGNDQAQVAAIALARPETRLVLAEASRHHLERGDLAVYVNALEMVRRFQPDLDQIRADFLDELRKHAPEDRVEGAKAAVEPVLEGLKQIRSVVVNFNFASQGLLVYGVASLEPDANPDGPSQVDLKPLLGRLPARMAFHLSQTDRTIGRSGDAGRQILAQLGVPVLTEILARNLDALKQSGHIATASALDLENGLKSLVIRQTRDPQALLKATLESFQIERLDPQVARAIKSIRRLEKPQTHRGYTFNVIEMTLDYDAILKNQPEADRAVVRKNLDTLIGSEGRILIFVGADDQVVLSVSARDWESARSILDASLDPTANLQGNPGFKAMANALPRTSETLFALSGRGLLRVVSILTGEPIALQLKQSVFVGFSLANQVNGVEFRLIVPSAMGTVIENGVIPALGRVTNQAAPPARQPLGGP
ncbi:hypothetical protein Isop_1858 [Isosphaera pallida ATCC 43644]|uniref:DUF3352 domain-containing protein n=2 Tax=Isosphaera pallida TaxID=128 RepID=E8R207_ISOPI|nr:hypothetical protein Isop_1858 [Isosphaera pallida ATCC 43644]